MLVEVEGQDIAEMLVMVVWVEGVVVQGIMEILDQRVLEV